MFEQSSTQVGRIEFEWGGQTFYFDSQNRTYQGVLPPSKFVLFNDKVYDARQGYPFEVLARVITEKPGQIVLVPLSGKKIFIFFAGTDKYVLLEEKEDDPEFVSRTFLRLYLESSGEKFYRLGDYPNIYGGIEVSPGEVELPRIISPKKSFFVIGGILFGALLIHFISMEIFAINGKFGDSVDSGKAQIMAQIEHMKKESQMLKNAITEKERHLQENDESLNQKKEEKVLEKPKLPEVTYSFTEAVIPYRYSSNIQLRVDHGRVDINQTH